jgi:hypothetical protein
VQAYLTAAFQKLLQQQYPRQIEIGFAERDASARGHAATAYMDATYEDR